MAKFTPSALVDQIRNKVGGIVFTHLKTGPMVRRRIAPTQPRSSRQTSVRTNLTDLAKYWAATLSDAQRAAWNALAAQVRSTDSIGNKGTLSGIQLFVSCNQNLLLVGEAIMAAAPADLSVTALLTETPTASAGGHTLSVAYTATPAAANHKVVVAASRQQSPGRTTSFSQPAFIKATAAAAASPFAVGTEYEAKYGTLIAGKKIRVQAFTVNTTNGAAAGKLASVITVAA